MPRSEGRPPDRERVFEALFRAHARSLLAYALRRVERREDAADIVSDTMLAAWRRLDDVPAGDDARPWLFGVARNVLANARRAGERSGRLGAKLREQLDALSLDDHAGDVETAVVVRSALERLSEDDRELLRLVSWEGLTPTQVAVALSVPGETVRRRLHRARSRMRDALREIGWNDQGTPGHGDDDEHVLVRKTEAQ
jgi:RNA polymerase sigma factor (sigma-70 family)